MKRITRSERVHLAQPGRPELWHHYVIDRPESNDLATDPAIIRGCRTLAQRVLIQAFEDATDGNRPARNFLTLPTGCLAHWVAQGDFGVSLNQFVIGARRALDGEAASVLALFRRRGPTQRKETDHE